MTRLERRSAVCILIGSALAIGALAQAAPASMNGQMVTVTLQETGFSDAVQTVTAGPGGPQIVGNDPSPSDAVGYILFSAESVNLHDLQIVYTMEGNGGVYTGSAPQCSGGCRVWDTAPSDARFLFSDLSFGSPNVVLQNVSLTANNVYDATVSNIGPTSFVLNFGAAGVPSSGSPVGTLTMDLQTTTVPLPPGLPMLAGGLLGMLAFRRSRSNIIRGRT